MMMRRGYWEGCLRASGLSINVIRIFLFEVFFKFFLLTLLFSVPVTLDRSKLIFRDADDGAVPSSIWKVDARSEAIA